MQFCTASVRAGFKPLRFQIDGLMYELAPENYYYVWQYFDVDICDFKISMREGSDFGVLGINFLQEHVQYYSLDHN